MKTNKLTRRDFIRLSSIGVVGLAALPALRPPKLTQAQTNAAITSFPDAPRLGRITADSLRIMTTPNPRGEQVGWKFYDEVLPIKRYVVGEGWYPHNHIWAEIEEGFLYSSFVQPVGNVLNAETPITSSNGFFGEITVPYVEARLGPGIEYDVSYRSYYSATFNNNRVETDATGQRWYKINDENGKTLWVPVEVVRFIDPEELAPISPEVEDKYIEVDLASQWLMAFENNSEVYRTRISSGFSFFGTSSEDRPRDTPQGSMAIWGKRISRHMEGGTLEAGWDLPGVGYVLYFSSNGAAVHSTFWHNDYGRPRSAGCLNCSPAAARWLFRWTTPHVDYDPGQVIVQWPGGTKINIYDSGRAANDLSTLA